MITSVAWRNVWRNKLRSSVILIAVAIGIFAGVFTWAFYSGMVEQRIETAISTESSNIQIHQPNYIEDPDVKQYIAGAHDLVLSLMEYDNVQTISARMQVNAMAMSAEQGTGVLVSGIVPENEKGVTNIYEKINQGTYFEGIKRNPIVIGNKLAKKLKLKERSKIVLTLQQMDGTITRAQFRVAGIYKISNSIYEELNVFVRSEDLARIIQIDPDVAHEIVIKVEDNELEQNLISELKTNYPDYDIKGWREIMPEVGLLEETGDISMIFFFVIILSGLCLAIINTMLMAVLERVKEIGMLMAIGMNRRKIFGMVLWETVFLTFSGTLIGILIASAIAILTGKIGIDLSMGADAYEAMGMSAIVYPILNYSIIIKVTIMVFVASLLSAIPPAIKALQLKPAEAIRSDM